MWSRKGDRPVGPSLSFIDTRAANQLCWVAAASAACRWFAHSPAAKPSALTLPPGVGIQKHGFEYLSTNGFIASAVALPGLEPAAGGVDMYAKASNSVPDGAVFHDVRLGRIQAVQGLALQLPG